jgi:hypothetical protein
MQSVKIGVRDAASRQRIRQIFTTSKIALDGEITPERRCHGHNSVNYPNPPLDWRAPNLAIQFWLGILAKWRTRLDPFDCSCPRLDGTNLSKNQDSA